MRSLDFVANSASKISKDLFDLNKQNKLISPCWEKVLTIYRKTFGSMIERHPLSRQEVLDFNEELDRLDYFKQLMMRRCLANCSPAYPAAYTIYHNAKDIITSTLPFTYDRRDRFKHILKVSRGIVNSNASWYAVVILSFTHGISRISMINYEVA